MVAATASTPRSDTAMELQPRLKWQKAPCRFCGTGCHAMAGVRDGRVVAVADDDKAPVNKGLLCAKGYHAGMALYGTDRLTKPLLRENGRLVPISWDLAIINCIAHLLIDKDAYDKQFVEKHCNLRADTEQPTLFGRPITFEDYKRLLEPYTRAYTRKLSGVRSKQLRMLTDLFANRNLKIVSLWCMGFNQHTRGTAVNNLIHGLHLFSGHWDRPGDGSQSLTGQPAACGSVREVGTLAHALPGGRLVVDPKHRKQAEEFWNLPAGRINPKPGYHTVEMWKRFCTPTDAYAVSTYFSRRICRKKSGSLRVKFRSDGPIIPIGILMN